MASRFYWARHSCLRIFRYDGMLTHEAGARQGAGTLSGG